MARNNNLYSCIPPGLLANSKSMGPEGVWTSEMFRLVKHIS